MREVTRLKIETRTWNDEEPVKIVDKYVDLKELVLAILKTESLLIREIPAERVSGKGKYDILLAELEEWIHKERHI